MLRQLKALVTRSETDSTDTDDESHRDRPELPIAQDDEKPPHEHDEDRREDIVGWLIPMNSLAAAVAPYRSEVEDRFGYDIPMVDLPDENWGGNMFQVEDVARQWQSELEQHLGWLAQRADYTITPMSLGGSGFLAVKLADVYETLPPTVDLVVSSHKLKTANDPASVAQTVIMQTAALPRIETGSVFVDHRFREVGYASVPGELAQISGAIGLTDMQDRQYGYWTLFYETVSVMTESRGQSRTELTKAVKRARNNAEPWFTPSDWAPWIDRDTAPVAGAPDVKVIVPNGCDINGHRMDFEIHEADVANAHVLGFVPLQRDWVERRLMWDGIEWLDAQFHDQQNRYYTVLRDLAGDYGVQDPLAEWAAFRDEHLLPAIDLPAQDDAPSAPSEPRPNTTD